MPNAKQAYVGLLLAKHYSKPFGTTHLSPTLLIGLLILAEQENTRKFSPRRLGSLWSDL